MAIAVAVSDPEDGIALLIEVDSGLRSKDARWSQ